MIRTEKVLVYPTLPAAALIPCPLVKPKVNDDDTIYVKEHMKAGDRAMSELEKCAFKVQVITEVYESWPKQDKKEEKK